MCIKVIFILFLFIKNLYLRYFALVPSLHPSLSIFLCPPSPFVSRYFPIVSLPSKLFPRLHFSRPLAIFAFHISASPFTVLSSQSLHARVINLYHFQCYNHVHMSVPHLQNLPITFNMFPSLSVLAFLFSSLEQLQC